MTEKNIYVIIPAHNESKKIGDVVRRAYEALPKAKVIVVDDGSSDATFINAQKAGAVMLKHTVNTGKGKSIMDAWFFLMNAYDPRPDDIIIHMDADGQHEPNNLKSLIELIDSDFDMAIGRRDLSKYPAYKRLGNIILSWTASVLAGQRVSDGESGFRAFNYYVMLDLMKVINPQGYELEIEINIATGMMGHKIGFVDVSEKSYRKGVGLLSGVKNFYAGLKTWMKIKTGWLKWQ
jgi:glycosyltransferase involved in cell wall biosynthesis